MMIAKLFDICHSLDEIASRLIGQNMCRNLNMKHLLKWLRRENDAIIGLKVKYPTFD
jgi:hypothetical protein